MKMYSTLVVAAFALAILSVAGSANAQLVTIQGTGALSWGAGIFPGGVLPLVASTVSLTTNAQVSVDTDVSIAGLNIDATAAASVNVEAGQSFETSDDTEINFGTLFINATGSYQCDGDMIVEAGQNAVADLVVGAKATVTVGGNLVMDAGARLAFEAENKADEAESGVNAIAVTGQATFDGTLEVILDDFLPSADVTLMTYASYDGLFADIEVSVSGSASTRRLLDDEYNVEYRDDELVMVVNAASAAAATTSVAVLAVAAALVSLLSSN